jgi:hypothetical protein
MSSGEFVEGAFVDGASVVAVLDELDAAFDKLAGMPLDGLSSPELLGVAERLETHRRRQPALEHAVLHHLTSQVTPAEVGGKSFGEVLSMRLCISRGEARRRLDEAEDLGPRRAISGEPLDPELPNVAAAQAGGAIGAEHVRIIRRFFAELPGAVDYQTRQECEATLADIATTLGPEQLRKAAERLAALVNPDGNYSDDERARRRHLVIGKQGPDGMSPINGLLDPQARATLDAVLAKWAAPGMCNPDDQSPTVDGKPSEAAISGDLRNQPQRNHDALTALGRAMLASGQLGQHNGLPASIIVSTTLAELQSGAGHAVTAGGTLLPMSDVIRLASHSYHHLVVFDNHVEVPLYLGRTRRTASPGQRIVLHAKDRGCTFPGCTVPGYGCQVHHAQMDWAKGGLTNIDDEALACGPHNRLVKEGSWQTRKRKDGRTEWIPPPHLDTGQTRTNDFHHPENLLMPAGAEQ